jgi:holo-[acyl-carrier protein] synthase
MIKGVGTDIVSISRVRNLLSENARLASLVLGHDEYAEFVKRGRDAAYLAKRFAAKEAIGKALGVGILLHIEVLNDEKGKPIVLGVDGEVHLSLSSDGDYAQAFAVVTSASES